MIKLPRAAELAKTAAGIETMQIHMSKQSVKRGLRCKQIKKKTLKDIRMGDFSSNELQTEKP